MVPTIDVGGDDNWKDFGATFTQRAYLNPNDTMAKKQTYQVIKCSETIFKNYIDLGDRYYCPDVPLDAFHLQSNYIDAL